MDVNYRLAAMLVVPALAGCMQAPDPRDAIAGTWQPVGAGTAAGEEPVLRYQLKDDRLHMTSSAGLAYAADLAGGETALEGAPPGTTVSVRQVPAVAYREIIRRNGRPVSVRIVAVADRQVATVFENRLDGSASVHAAINP